MEVLSFIKEIADDKIDVFLSLGHAIPGTNGAYKCQDSPVRNTSHWCVIYSFLAQKYSEQKYFAVCKVFGDYLHGIQNKSKNGTLECILDGNFDNINGLIGQAWAMEGLIALFKTLEDKTYIEDAARVFKSQVFDPTSTYWKRVDTQGHLLGIDNVLNHQLWFAAIGSELLRYIDDPVIDAQVTQFVNSLQRHFMVDEYGRIKHFGDIKRKATLKTKLKRVISSVLPYGVWKINPDKLHVETYEDSYQLFNLYGLAILYNYGFKDNAFFYSREFQKALQYGLNIDALNKVFNVFIYEQEKPLRDVKCKIAKFAYPYNSPAFEYGYISKTFLEKTSEDEINRLLKIQKNLCYSEMTKMFDRNTNDPQTLTARIYELVRFLEMLDNVRK